jgi:integrase
VPRARLRGADGAGLGDADGGAGLQDPGPLEGIAIDRLIARREVHLREKTLWRMLYETAGRPEEILGVNIEELDFAGHRFPVKAKGAEPRPVAAGRRGRTSCWRPCTGTLAARLLPRLLKGRTRGAEWCRERWGSRRPGDVSDNITPAADGLAASPLGALEWPRHNQ